MKFASRELDLSAPLIMGVLNTTPDSFSDGGSYYQTGGLNIDLALKRAEQMVNEGASFIDIGGESTRPGAEPVGIEQELARVVPVVEAISQELDVVVSVDTSTAQVITESAKVGAGLINDVRALTRDGALAAGAATGLPVCLMHMQGCPQTMQDSPEYWDVLGDVSDYLESRVQACQQAGIGADKILLDPGFGFGKNDQHNLSLLAKLPKLLELGYPLLVGMSRKSMIGRLLNRQVDERLAGSLALAMLAADKGASIIRVHDVAQTRDVIKMRQLLLEYS